MDDPSVDAIAKLIATTTRRHSLRLLAGALLAGPLALLGPAAADAACARPGRTCGDGKKCCPGATCRGGTCRCKAGRTKCDGRCVDTQTSETHCGACNAPCDPTETCVEGVCQPPAVCSGELCPNSPACGGTPAAPCICRTRFGGGAICGGPGPVGTPCTTDQDCDAIFPGLGRCVVTCAGTTACVPACAG